MVVIPVLPVAKLTVESSCSGIPIARRFSITRATLPKSSGLRASSSTRLALVITWLRVSAGTPTASIACFDRVTIDVIISTALVSGSKS